VLIRAGGEGLHVGFGQADLLLGRGPVEKTADCVGHDRGFDVIGLSSGVHDIAVVEERERLAHCRSSGALSADEEHVKCSLEGRGSVSTSMGGVEAPRSQNERGQETGSERRGTHNYCTYNNTRH